MSSETWMGIGVVIVLVCTFAFLVYHKFDLRQQQLARIKAGETSADTGEDVRPAALVQPADADTQQPGVHAVAATPRVTELEHTHFSVETKAAAQDNGAEYFATEAPTAPAADGLAAPVTAPAESNSVAAAPAEFSPQQFDLSEPPQNSAASPPSDDPFAALEKTQVATAVSQPGGFFDEPSMADSSDESAGLAAEQETPSERNSSPAPVDPFSEFPAGDDASDTNASIAQNVDQNFGAPPSAPNAYFPAEENVPVPGLTVTSSSDDAQRTPAPTSQFPEADGSGIFASSAVEGTGGGVTETVQQAPTTSAESEPSSEPSAVPSFDEFAQTEDVSDTDDASSDATQEPRVLLAQSDFPSGARSFAESRLPATRSAETPRQQRPALPATAPLPEFPEVADQRPAAFPPTDDAGSPAEVPVSLPPEFSGSAGPSPSPFEDTRNVARQRPATVTAIRPAPSESIIQKVAAIADQCQVCEVRPKDNYWTISKRVYGTARYFSALALFNQERIPDPKKLRPGMKVLVPNPSVLHEMYPELLATNSRKKSTLATGFFVQKDGRPAYRVGDRETLSEISQKHLGRASRWIEIYRLNQTTLKDPNRLKPGSVLILPEDATNVSVAP